MYTVTWIVELPFITVCGVTVYGIGPSLSYGAVPAGTSGGAAGASRLVVASLVPPGVVFAWHAAMARNRAHAFLIARDDKRGVHCARDDTDDSCCPSRVRGVRTRGDDPRSARRLARLTSTSRSTVGVARSRGRSLRNRRARRGTSDEASVGMLRFLLIAALVACHGGPSGYTCGGYGTSPPPNCHCEGEYVACDDCPFDHGGSQACQAGATCGISGFEKDCSCRCVNALWQCEDGLVSNTGTSSHCPYVVDAGVD
jgi:hypothetical protein